MAWRLTGSAAWADNEPGKGHLRKRSYQNAKRRAVLHGGTWYKNQWLTSTVLADPPTPKEWQPPMRRTQLRGKRLKILSWNARSLSMELWHEVQMYSKLHQFDLVFLQSTCWTFTSNWMANGYYIAHSGSTADPHSGLLIMVNQSLGKADDISLGDPLAGRLQHLRVKTGEITLDLVNTYQHPWRPTMSHEENLTTRRVVWETLHESLTHLPFRNRLVLAGDFNTSIVNNAHVDAKELKHIIQHHGLGSLLQSRNKQPTYYAQNGNSQIDFVFGRQCQLDSHAKNGTVDVQTPLASWREAPDHRPLICNMPTAWRPWRRKPQNTCSGVQLRDHLRTHAKTASPQWQHLCQVVRRDVEAMPIKPELIENLQTLMLSRATQCTQPKPTNERGLDFGSPLQRMWSLHRESLRWKPTTLKNIFQLWCQRAEVQRLRKQLRKFCKQNKRAKVEEQIQEAIDAYKKQDPYRMYKVVRTLAPKMPFRTVQLRSKYGLAQDPNTELKELADFFGELCKGQEIIFPEQTLSMMPFSCDDLQRSLAGTPSTKSVAPGCCPGLVIKTNASILAPWLYHCLEQMWCQSGRLTIPSKWKDAWVRCVPKRTVRSPKDIRPISLQCPIGKAVLRTVVRQAIDYIKPSLAPLPIFAYLRGRSTEQALLRVHQHLKQVRDRCQLLTYNVWTRKAGHDHPPCHGGITLSLDLSNAFDTVNRRDIEAGMHLTHVPVDIRNVLLCWLNQVQYHLGHKGNTTTIDVTRGIRQGCVASPFLWLMWTAHMLSRLSTLLGTAWTGAHLSIYADDIISQWNLFTKEDIRRTIQEMGTLLDVLDDLNLTISLKKCAVLLRIVGTSRTEIYKRHTCRHEGQTCLIIPRKGGKCSYLPIVKQHKYLGSMLSYTNPEDSTLTLRLQSGKQAFFRLIKFLGKSHVLPLKQKLKLWTQCVLCSYLYGLFAVGITPAGLTRLSRSIIQDLRRITQKWSHLTHVTNLELCQDLKMQMPIDELQVRWHEHATRQLRECQNLEPNDILLQFDLHEHWISLHTQIAEWHHHNHDNTSHNMPCDWRCPYCDAQFVQRSTMRRHVVQKHAELEPPQNYVPIRDALHGLPQCRHCKTKLTSRPMLRKHIEHKHCQAFDPEAREQTTVAQREDVLDKVREQRWQELLEDRALCKELTNHCALCQHWCSLSNGLAAHQKKSHGDIYVKSQIHRAAINQYIRYENKTCTTCHTKVQQQHTCPVVMQLAVIKQLTLNQDAETETPRKAESHRTAGLKRKSPFEGAYHPQEVLPQFDAARDCKAGMNTCNHCHTAFGDFIGLKRHIELARCKRFRADRPPQPWILQNQEPVMRLMTSLHPEQWLCEREFVARLRKECAICGRQFDHFKGLLLHLNNEHYHSTIKAMPYAEHILDNYHPMGEACLCGHWLTTDAKHTCVVALQLGILRHKSREETSLMPYAMIPTIIDHWLLHGKHEKVLAHPEYKHIFSCYCSLCLNRHETPALLWEHFEKYHSDMLPNAIAHLDRIVRERQECCPACQSLHARELSQAPRCPFLLNCLLLEHLRYGPPEHDGRRRERAPQAERHLRQLDEPRSGPSAEQEEETRPPLQGCTPRLRAHATKWDPSS